MIFFSDLINSFELITNWICVIIGACVIRDLLNEFEVHLNLFIIFLKLKPTLNAHAGPLIALINYSTSLKLKI